MVNITVTKQKFCTLWFTKLPIIIQTVVHVLYKLRFTMGYALVYYGQLKTNNLENYGTLLLQYNFETKNYITLPNKL